jgi:hypothetical protein
MGRSTEELHPHIQKSVDALYNMVEEITYVTKHKILMKSNKRHIVDARKIFANVARNYIKLSQYEVAKALNKDHSTILHYEKVHKSHMHEKEYRRQYSAVAGMYAISDVASVNKAVEHQSDALIELEEEFNSLQSKMKKVLESIRTHSEKLNYRETLIK